MPRKRNRKPLTESQIKEIKWKAKNYKNKKRYAINQMQLFLIEYARICRKYGCYIGLGSGFIYKQKRGETIYTIKSHLKSVERNLENHY